MSRPTEAPEAITITIDLQVAESGELKEGVTYSSGSAHERKEQHRSKIRHEKKRGKTFKLPHGDHSEDPDHDSWIPHAGDTVVWSCSREFMLYVDYDLGVCDKVDGAPHHPFDNPAFNGVQRAREISPGRFEIRGLAVRNALVDHQLFYKYTAWVEGAEPLDPDGICPVGA